MEYGVGITNRYAFLEDDVDDDIVIAAPPPVATVVAKPDKGKAKNGQKKGVVVKKKPSPKTGDDWGIAPKAIVDEPPQYRDFNGGSGRGRGGGASRGSGRGGGAGLTRKGDFDRRDTGGGNQSDKRYNDFDDSAMEPPQHRDFGGTRGRGGTVGGRGFGRGGGFTRRRDFDRLSGSERSGVKPTDKRDGAGAHNWGTYKDEMIDEPESRSDDFVKDDADTNRPENGQGDADAEPNGNGTNGETEGDETEVIISTEPKVEEPKLFTLEQWKAMQQPKSTPNFNIRKPNEGEDPSKWKNLVLKKKENLEEDEGEFMYEEEDIWVPQRAGRMKRITDIGFHFVDDRDEQRTFRRGGSIGPKPMRERQYGADGEEITGTGNGRGSGYGGFGRGSSRGTSRGGYRRDRPSQNQGQRGRSQDVPRVDDTKEWPSLMC